ncbi:hypothetical protein NDU88_000025 [Pleurodeles waltl]|uniref:C2H2-type domain-containing protein n=1 Tax=Pleurodeles waltl TaxID=8319 RepID=A0AAV7WHA9_PLEWA|nr:hypothetical protein NDU88_000025 [Pleurodeles waltl]
MEKPTTDKEDSAAQDDKMPDPIQCIQLRHPSRVLPRVPRSVLARLVMVRPDPSLPSLGRDKTASLVRKAGDSVKTAASSPRQKGNRVKAASSPPQRPITQRKASSKPIKKAGKQADKKSAAKESLRPTQRRNLADKSVPSEEGSWTVRLVRLEMNTLKKYKRKLEECVDKPQPHKARAVKKEVWYLEQDEDDIWDSGEDEDDVWNSNEDDDWDSGEDEEFQYRPKKPKKMQNSTARNRKNYSAAHKLKKPVGKSKSSTEIPRTQSGVKKYPCPDCGIVFFQKSNLIEHQVFHKEADLPGVKEKDLLNNSNASINRKVNKSKNSGEKGHFNEMKSASKHPQSTQEKKPHPCDECEKSFNAYEMLLQHKRVHASEKAFMHPEGKKGVSKHFQKPLEKKPHPCDECEKSFNAYEMLLQHKRVHASEKASKWIGEKKNVSKPKSDNKPKVEKKTPEKKPHPCSDCDLSFNSASVLFQHQKVHTREKPSMHIDGKKSKPKVETKPSEKKPYPCSDCDLSFNSSLVLLQHQKLHTTEKGSTLIDEKKSVGKPKVEVKGSVKKPYPCSECEMSFNTSSVLLLHQKVHASEKDTLRPDEKNTAHKLGNPITGKMSTCCESEKCSHDSSPPSEQPKIDTSLNASVCLEKNSLSTLESTATEKMSDENEKCLNPSSTLLHQQKLSTSAKTCMCNICGKTFSKSSRLIIHRRVHTGYFACNECGKSFSALSSLKVHQIKHKGSKSYSCNECGKTFKIPSYLELHQRIHTLEKWRDKRGSRSKKRSLKKSKFGKKALKGF